ncbi:MAG: hypothetical protein A2046_16025 [Bacteroidetes bacterium GWA2_30_7]|nr:MAG: hypothetical protein A2046_16025 [Bacteroidetes bacterium GWA2_30_7]
MENILITFFKILFLIIVPLILKSQDIFNLENSEKYANWLFETKDYRLASEEYERINFMHPEVKINQIRLVQSYRLSKNYISGINKAKEYYTISNDIVFLEEELKMNLLARQFHLSDSILGLQPFPKNKKDFYKFASLLLIDSKKLIVDNSVLVSNLNTKAETELLETAIKYSLEKRKSPALASVMSAVIPGSGKIYVGDWKNGLMSFLYVAATSFNAYRGFRKHGVNSGYGWVYSGLSFCFYAGNIWGSHKEAVNFNKRKKKILEEKVDKIINN